MTRKIEIPLMRIKTLYDSKRFSTEEIASRLHVSQTVILSRMKDYGIPRRRSGPRLRQTIRVPKRTAQLAYLAGIIDGEGSIFNGYNHNGVDKRIPRITVRNKDVELKRWLLKNIGGSTDNGECYHWIVNGAINVKVLLEALSPYLIIKRSKATSILPECDRRIKLWMKEAGA